MRKKTHNLAKKSGFTLLELLITLGVIAIAILALYEVFIFTLKTTRQAKNTTYAYQAAEEEREIIKNTSFANLINQTDGNFFGQVQSLAKLTGGQGYLTIANYGENEKIKEISINVSWQESGLVKNYAITTLRTEGE